MKFYFIGYIRKLKFTPNVGLEPTTPAYHIYILQSTVGLEPTTLRLRVSCSTA